MDSIFNVWMMEKEGLCDYVKRLNATLVRLEGLDDSTLQIAFKEGLSYDSDLDKSLYKKKPLSIEGDVFTLCL